MGYSQSAVSQTVKNLEDELGTVLISRGKDGLSLTKDGEVFMPYLQAVSIAGQALEKKREEMQGLENGVIRIGTFTSISRNILPELMEEFKRQYPKVRFELHQGEYTSISGWIKDGSLDFGFVNTGAVTGLTVNVLYEDEMMAVLPKGHRLADMNRVSLEKLAGEPLILLDEGQQSVALEAFEGMNLSPDIEYKVYDDYTILEMVRRGLGISIMYGMVLRGFEDGLAIRPVREKLRRTVAIAWRDWDTMPLAARRFAKFIMESLDSEKGKVLR